MVSYDIFSNYKKLLLERHQVIFIVSPEKMISFANDIELEVVFSSF